MSIALQTLAEDLHVSVSTIHWVSTGYLLALGVTIPVVGWAQARIGGKRLWMIGLTVFLVTSIACSLAWNASSLIAVRVVQGVGGIILNWGSRPWLFWVNVPFCLLGLALAWRFLPADEPSGRAKLDTVGLLLVFPALVGILYGLSNMNKDGGFARTDVWLPTAAGVVLLVAFAVWALRRPRPPSSTSACSVAERWDRRRRSYSSPGPRCTARCCCCPCSSRPSTAPTRWGAALLLIPQGVGALMSRKVAGHYTDLIGARIVAIVGFLVMGLATIPFALADADTGTLWLTIVLAVRGFGMGR
ncbi:MFS transporter [Rhodococcus sp. NPDC003318]|uniref:MFS transporter n=1 Tax=Rhodococcus sp. NPDC003318 TaxID=3364503 RepID=UPI0036A19C0E